MAPETSGTKTRKPVKRLTAAEKREKAIAGVGDNVARVSTLLINIADGFMASGDRERAKRTLDIWTMVVDINASTNVADGQPLAD